MSSAIARKGSKTVTRPRKKGARRQVRQLSWFDRLLQSLPLSQEDVQRVLTWAILAVLLLAAVLVANWFGLPQAAYRQFGLMTAKAGFKVEDIALEGTKRLDQMKVYDVVLDEKEPAILLVDLDRIRSELMNYGWIKEVRVSRQLPNRLLIQITERKPVAVWQHNGKYRLLDDEGKVLDAISEAEIGNMPVVSGANAYRHLGDLAVLLDKAQSLKSQVAGANWVGNRRWDLRFRTGEILSLPEGDELAGQALVNFTRMDGVHRLLERNIIYFDLRDPDRMYMREAPKPKAELNGQPSTKSTSAEGSA
jgi:cell division protein FtsQ